MPVSPHLTLEETSISRKPGTYVLHFHLPDCDDTAVGRLGRVRLEAGLHVYVGSALGPGGLRARVGRHLRAKNRSHWHVDFLTGIAVWREIWLVESEERLECDWAGYFAALPDACVPVPHFGSTDCRCRSHLIRLAAIPDFLAFVQAFPAAQRLPL